jgi:hypothetical protein
MKTPTHTAPPVALDRLVRLCDVIRIVSEHPEYPEPCPMLHDLAGKAAAEMDKGWVMHMVREACRQTKEAILADLNNSLPNAEHIHPPTQDSASTRTL